MWLAGSSVVEDEGGTYHDCGIWEIEMRDEKIWRVESEEVEEVEIAKC